MKLCTMYKIVHGLTDFHNPPISYRSNPHCLRHLNTYTAWKALGPGQIALPALISFLLVLFGTPSLLI